MRWSGSGRALNIQERRDAQKLKMQNEQLGVFTIAGPAKEI
jgi:hypothetical protein